MSSTSASYTPISITPSFSVQCDWDQVLREYTAARSVTGGIAALGQESKQFWLSIPDKVEDKVMLEEKKEDGNNAPASATSLTASARSINAKCGDASLSASFLTPLQLLAHHTPTNATQTIQAPRSTWSTLHPSEQDIFTVDVNPAGTLGISGSTNGSLRTWDASNGTLAKELVGHAGDVRLARFFPSGSVAITTGLDLTMRIWACDSGQQAVCIKGAHSRSISQIIFLERGRHIITSGEDGQAKLWDISTQASIASYPQHIDAFGGPKFTDAVLLDPTQHTATLKDDKSQLPDSSTGNLLLLGGSDGILRGFDLRAQNQVFMIPTGVSGGIESLAQGPMQYACTFGSAEGVVGVVDLRKKLPLAVLRQDDASITNVRPWSDDAFWTTSSTGAVNLWRVGANDSSSSSSSVIASFSGADCEPIHDMCIASNFAYLSSFGAVRVYSLALLNQKHQGVDLRGLEIPQRRTSASATPTAATASA